MMKFAEFRNALCILTSIDAHELVEAGVLGRPGLGRAGMWNDFLANPYRFLLRADDETAAKIWSIIERRSRPSMFKVTEALRIDDEAAP